MVLTYETSLPRRKFAGSLNLLTGFKLIVCSHSGLFAIKDYRDAVNQDDFNKAVRKLAEAKKLEGKLEYQKL